MKLYMGVEEGAEVYRVAGKKTGFSDFPAGDGRTGEGVRYGDLCWRI